ncbi:MAG: hypothetical protein DYG98_06970 [Haliscomenobacteraceae bacterium CHB4]|nr:hypothetical protein [Haliscomenobacteraceae bacterium CHB4]
MKRFIKFSMFFGLMALFLGACQPPNKFTTGNEKNLAEILEDYSKNQPGVGFTIVTNQPSSVFGFNGPPATWTLGTLKKSSPSESDPIGGISIGGFVLRSPNTGADRYWSYRTSSNDVAHPFDPAQTDRIVLEIRVTGNDAVQIKIFKEETNGNITTFPVEIYGYLTGAKGHLIYGRYGGFNGLITISLWDAQSGPG